MMNINIELILKSLESMPTFILIDKNCKVVYINQRYCDLLGVSIDEAIGKHINKIIPNTLMPGIIKSGKSDMGAIMDLYDHRIGKNITIACSRIPIVEDDKVIGAVAMTTLNDIEEIPRLYGELARLKDKIQRLTHNSSEFKKVIGKSPSIEKIKNTIADYARSYLPVLITGETGVGKEVFASAIHELSDRKNKPYVKINCASLPFDLLESELFGYESGAFTGAKSTGKMGRFEAANHGTILLDEIGEMPLFLQSKLLRVLQEQEIEKIGATSPTKIDVRVICTTNRNIFNRVMNNKFREDLYYRINTIELEVPPLRERLEDLEDLANFFIECINKESNINTQGIEDDVIDMLKNYNWPGNVRELKHTIERLCFINKDSVITMKDCDFIIKKISASPLSKDEKLHGNWNIKKQKEIQEISMIIDAISKTGGNKAKASKLLGIERSLLYYKIKKYNIKI